MKEAARQKKLASLANPKQTQVDDDSDERKKMREEGSKFDIAITKALEEWTNPFSQMNMELAMSKTYKPGEPGYVDPTVDAVTGRKFSELALDEAKTKQDAPKDDSDYERAYLEATSPKSVSGPSRK